MPSLENGNNPEKIASSKYYDIDEIHNIEILTKTHHHPHSI